MRLSSPQKRHIDDCYQRSITDLDYLWDVARDLENFENSGLTEEYEALADANNGEHQYDLLASGIANRYNLNLDGFEDGYDYLYEQVIGGLT
jgi:hypothetical protein